MTPEEEDEEISRGIALDPDNPEWTEADLPFIRPTSEVMPELVEQYLRWRGKQKAPTKVLVSLRLDRDVVERLRASGPGWQTRANAMLKKAVGG